MDLLGDELCLSCGELTKYKCLICNSPTCNLCCVPEIDEDVDGWCVGLSVGYCSDNCHLNIQHAAKNTGAVKVASRSSTSPSTSLNTTPKNDDNIASSSEETRFVNIFLYDV